MGGFADMLGMTKNLSSVGSRPGERSADRREAPTQAEIARSMAKAQMTMAVLGVIVRGVRNAAPYVLRFWWIWVPLLLPVLLGLPIQLVFSVLFFPPCYWLNKKIGGRVPGLSLVTSKAKDANDVRKAGGEENLALYDDIKARWRDVTLACGLAGQKGALEGIGIARAAHELENAELTQVARTAFGANEADFDFPELIQFYPTSLGLASEVRMIPGQVADDYAKSAQALADAFAVREVRVKQIGPGVVRLNYASAADPLAAASIDYDWTQPSSIERVPLGIDEEREVVTVKILESNLLVGGEPGSGKSVAQTVILAGVSQLPHVALIGLDPKQVELSPWRPRFTYVATELEESVRVLRACVKEMNRRYSEVLVPLGKKKFEASDFTDTCPLLFIDVDEIAELTAAGEDRKLESETGTLLRRLVAKGRAAGVVTMGCTQKPSADVIPTSYRDLNAQRLCFRTGTADMTETIVGSGRSIDAPAHKIDVATRGVAWILAEGSPEPRRMRTYWIPDEWAAELAARTAHLRPSWELPMDSDEEEW